MNFAKCPLCGVPTDRVLATELRRGEGTVFQCMDCNHGFLVSEKQVDTKAYYSEAYWKEVSHRADSSGTNAAELFDVYSKYQGERLRLISPYLSKSASLLEIGSSAGQFLVHVKDEVARADAIDLDRACAQYVRSQLGLDADSEFLKQSKFADRKYDIICSFQVMEHVDRPVDFLADIRSSLAPGGTAFVEVPNLDDPLRVVWDIGPYEKFYYHSAHLQYFSEKSLRKVAVAAGFSGENLKIEFTQDYNLLNHLNWIMSESPQPTCDWGLSEIHLRGRNSSIADWLSAKLRDLNQQYVSKLAEAKATSNLMAILTVE